MLKIDTREIKQLEHKLRRLSREAIPKAMAAALNRQLDLVNKEQTRNVRRMTLRTPYTLGSLKVSPAKVRSSGAVGYGEVGSISRYLPLQEAGGKVRARRKVIAIPTPMARVGRSKRGVVASRFRLRNRARHFVLPTRSGKRMLVMRQGKRLLWLRDISRRSIRIPARHWHTAAVKRFGTLAVASAAYTKELKREIARLQGT